MYSYYQHSISVKSIDTEVKFSDSYLYFELINCLIYQIIRFFIGKMVFIIELIA